MSLRTPLALAVLLPALGLAAALDQAPAPAPVFERLPSTRRVTRLLPLGERLLVGTTGGLVVLAPGPDGTLVRSLLLPGTPIRDLIPESPTTALAATDSGPARIGPGGAALIGTGPVSSLFMMEGRILLARPTGKLEALEGAAAPLALPGPAPVQALVRHRSILRAASLDGLFRLDPAAGPVPETLAPDPLATHLTVLATLADHLYAGTPVGLFERTETAWRPVPCTAKHPPHVTALALDPEGTLVAASAGDGLWRLRTGRLEPFAPVPALATALAAWRGALWAGSEDSGAFPVEAPGSTPTLGPDEPPSNAITSLAWAGDWQTLAVGTFDRGVGLRSPTGWRRAGLGAGLPSDWVNQVASDGNRVLARLSDGNVLASRGSDAWVPLGKAEGWPKAWTSALGSDRGRLWAGTRNAFFLSLQSTWEVFAPKPELDGVDVLDVALRDTEAWIATHRHGLLRWDRWRRRWDRLTHGTGLPDPWVTCVEVFRGRVFAGTFDGGLAEVLDQGPGSKLEGVRVMDAGPLPSPAIEALLATDDALFVATLDGLAVSRDGKTFTHYGLVDGLPDPHVTSLASDGERLWVGTPSGLARARLDALVPPPAGGAP